MKMTKRRVGGKTRGRGGKTRGSMRSRAQPSYGGGGDEYGMGGGDMPIGGGGGGGYDLSQMDPYGGDGGGGPANTVPCSKCGRNFGADRVGKHEKVCKVNSKPRKVKRMYKKVSKAQLAREKASKPTTNWRKEHGDFV